MKNYDTNKESLYLMYSEVSNLYGWKMLQKLLVDSFKWTKGMLTFDKDYTKNYDEDSDTGHILEVDVKYLKQLHELHNNLPFLPKI